MGFLIGPRVLRMFQDSKQTTALIHAQKFVEAYTEWTLNNDEDCPDSLNELTRLMNSKEMKDPWGREFVMACGEEAPEGVPFGVISTGPDRKKGTVDDIKSWESKKKKARAEE